jgi:hypothetical protein
MMRARVISAVRPAGYTSAAQLRRHAPPPAGAHRNTRARLCPAPPLARLAAGWSGANSSEFDAKSPHPVVIFMPEINPSQMGGTMRLGARATMLRGRVDGAQCLAKQVYTGCKLVWERHRHRCVRGRKGKW